MPPTTSEPRTEEAYWFWIRRYIHFHSRQHPRSIGPNGIVAFINYLASAGGVAASTQSQAFDALLFLYRDVLEVEVGRVAKTRINKWKNCPLSWEPSRWSHHAVLAPPHMTRQVRRKTECKLR